MEMHPGIVHDVPLDWYERYVLEEALVGTLTRTEEMVKNEMRDRVEFEGKRKILPIDPDGPIDRESRSRLLHIYLTHADERVRRICRLIDKIHPPHMGDSSVDGQRFYDWWREGYAESVMFAMEDAQLEFKGLEDMPLYPSSDLPEEIRETG